MKRRTKDLSQFAIAFAILLVLNYIGGFKFGRLDLTSEKRYSLSEATVSLLDKIDDRILFTIYLEGNFPSGFQKLQRETKQMLDEFRAYNPNIEYLFINPSEGDEKNNREVYNQLHQKGLSAIQVAVEESGSRSQIQVFPGAIVSYQDQEMAVQLLLDQFSTAPEAQINNSIQNLEYTLASVLRRLVIVDRPKISFLTGHGELEAKYIADFARELNKSYQVDRFNLREFTVDSTGAPLDLASQMRKINTNHLIIIAKPTKPFSDFDRFLIDQYLMSGGRIMWLVDAVHAEMDSLSFAPQFLAYPTLNQLHIDDMLFKYGVRINNNLLQDLVAAGVNDRREINRWVYFPLLLPISKHPITKDLNAVKVEFVSSIDTIIAPGVKKTFLLRTSPYTKKQPVPGMVSLQTLYDPPVEASFNEHHLPVAVLLEGEFESVYKNRIKPTENGRNIPFQEKSRFTQQLIVADGDIIKNQLNLVNSNMQRGMPLPLGYDQFTGMQYGNKEFLMNTVDYMLDPSGLINVRSRELKLRLLDLQKVKDEKTYWQVLNAAVPILFIIVFGIIYFYLRRRKYAH